MSEAAKTTVWEEYKAGLEYQTQMGFETNFPSYESFKEGEQWPQATARTKNLPRPVFNIVDMFIRTKRAAICNQPLTIQYSPSEYPIDVDAAELATQGASDFTDYVRQLWEDCRQDELNNELVDDAATLGTGILHYFFDNSVRGYGEHPYVGEIRGETLDPLNVFPGDPQCRDIQRQPYIIVSQRVDAEAVKSLAKEAGINDERLRLLEGDDKTENEGYTAAKYELKNRRKLTLLTKYYRDNDGGVVFDRCTETVEIIKAQPLTPAGAPRPITLYPIVVMNWYGRKKSLFGIGECQTLIPAQKAVNFLKAMELMSAQQTAWPKILTKPGALHQTITNEPGEVIVDHYGNGPGISYLNPPAMSSGASALAQSIFDLMRTVSGVNEAATGESMGTSMAASAIIALQSQAQKPIEEVQSHFWRAIKSVGAIWAEMIKAYYDTERNITSEEITDGEDPADRTRGFTGRDYADVDFRLRIDVGTSSQYSESLVMSTLDNFLARGFIDQFDYVELAPRNVVPFADRLKKRWSDRDEQMNIMRQQVMQEMQAQGMPLPGMEQPTGVEGAPLPQIPHAPTLPTAGR